MAARYLLFGNEEYVPYGGAADLIEVYEDTQSLEDIVANITKYDSGKSTEFYLDDGTNTLKWFQIYDLLYCKMVAWGNCAGPNPSEDIPYQALPLLPIERNL